MALEYSWGAVEQPFESLDQDGSQRSCAQVAGHALVAVQHALVVAEDGEYVGQGVIVGNQRQVLFEVSGEVVDLEVVVGLSGFGDGRGRSQVHLMRRTAFALEVAGQRRRMVLCRMRGHGALSRSVRFRVGHTLAWRDAGLVITTRAE